MQLHRTLDGGTNWSSVTLPEDQAAVIAFADSRHGWLLASGSAGPNLMHLYATNDAGESWDQLPDPPIESARVAFRSPSEGWLWTIGQGSSHVYVSTDGGQSWQTRDLQAPPDRLPEETVAVSNLRVLPGIGVLADVILRQGQEIKMPPRKVVSLDMGVSWRYVLGPSESPVPGLEAFEDSKHWWRIDGGILYKSFDSGTTWKSVATLQNGDLWVYDAYTLDSRHAWAQVRMGEATGLGMTNDGGLHWTPANVPQPA